MSSAPGSEGRFTPGRLTLPATVIARTGPDPAAGAEIAVTVPGGVVWKVYTLRVTLVTSAVAGGRLPCLAFDDGTVEFLRAVPNATSAVSATHQLTYGAGLPSVTPTASHSTIGLPATGILMLPGWRIRSVTNNLDVGDNYGVPAMLVREFDITALDDADPNELPMLLL